MTKYCISCYKKFSNRRPREYNDIHDNCLCHYTWVDTFPLNIDSFAKYGQYGQYDNKWRTI